MWIRAEDVISRFIKLVDEKGNVATNVMGFNTRTNEAEVTVIVLVDGGPNIAPMDEGLNRVVAKCFLPGFRVLFQDTDEQLVTEEQAADYLSKLESQSNG